MEGRASSCGCWAAGCRFISRLRSAPPPKPAAAAAPPAAANSLASLQQQIPTFTIEQLDALIPLIEQEVDRLAKSSSSSSQAPISQRLGNMLVKWQENKQICTSFVNSLPKELTDEVAGKGRSLLMPLLTEALGGMGAVHWLGIGFTFIAWSLDNINNTIQNRDDCIRILGKSLRLLRNTKQIWENTHMDDAQINEDLQDSVEKAFHCAIFCTSGLSDLWILRFLKAATVKEAITRLDKELDDAKLNNIGVTTTQNFLNLQKQVERQPTFHVSPGDTEGKREVMDDAVTFLDSSHQHIKAVLLHGMGGIGKSTQGLQIFTEFQTREFQNRKYYRACRVELPFETREGDLCDIQRQILEKVTQHAASKPSNLTDGKQIMEKELKQVKDPIFLYVDNVLERQQLSQLLPKASFFPEGSKLLITSRGTHTQGSFGDLGIQKDSYKAIEVRKLQEQQAQLLLWGQLGSAEGEHRNTSDQIKSLEKRVLDLCDGLPLALVVVGKYIAASEMGLTNVEVWRQVVDDMQKAQPFDGNKNDELYSRIEFSIQNLDARVKGAFLDVVFFLNISPLWEISWEGLEWLVGQQNLKVFCQRGLILRKDERRHTVEMHDVLKAQLGRRMVEDDKDERRITGMDQFNELQHSDLEKVIALCDVTVDALRLKQMPHLRLLKNVQVTGECEEIQLRKLRVTDGLKCSRARVFDWSKCESLKQVYWGEERPIFFHTSKGGALDASNLEVFKHHKDLEALALRGWSQLKDVEVIETFTYLKKLQLLYCPEIEFLPDGLSRLTSLEELRLSGCKSLQSIPKGIGNLTAVTQLHLRGCESLQSIPEGIGNLTAVTWLDLSGCESLQSIPEGIGNLTAVTRLDLRGCTSLQSIPEGIGNLAAVTELDLSWCKSLQSIPEGIGNLTAVTWLDLTCCTRLESLPEAVTRLSNLTRLSLLGCRSLQCLPRGLSNRLLRSRDLELQPCLEEVS